VSEASNTAKPGSVPRLQAWDVTCHGCLASARGYAKDREEALSTIETWKSEHRLTPGCGGAPMSDAVAAADYFDPEMDHGA
jgi:hypothetical protein